MEQKQSKLVDHLMTNYSTEEKLTTTTTITLNGVQLEPEQAKWLLRALKNFKGYSGVLEQMNIESIIHLCETQPTQNELLIERRRSIDAHYRT